MISACGTIHLYKIPHRPTAGFWGFWLLLLWGVRARVQGGEPPYFRLRGT